LAGIERFLTQKLSWNRFNKPAHHTFTWEGIDGSQVLAHFPPADTYNAIASVQQLRENARNYKDHDRSRHSLMLFGIGDGGGGPTKHMLEILSRAKDLQGLPRTELRTSDEFFTLLEKDLPANIRPKLIGELYFELHRGTYTTQAANKKGNRKSELLLHDAEFLSAIASKTSKLKYPSQELERLWKIVLLNQFHDILPGSSITLVYDDSKKDYAAVESSATKLRDAALSSLSRSAKPEGAVPINTVGVDRREVAMHKGKPVFVDVPSYGIGEIADAADVVTVEQAKKQFVIENDALRAIFATSGRLISLIHKSTDREALAGEGNCFEMYDDQPTAWDAWDVDPFHLETRRACGPASSAKIISDDPLRAEIEFTYTIGAASTIRQIVRLDAGSSRLEFDCRVDWNESRKFLKVCFPANVRAMNATYEMQFGSVERPTHFNTSYDLARFEVPGHKWMGLSEHGFGVALLNESKYGFSTFGNEMRISLLRAPKYPDPQADIGKHEFSYAIYPHAGDWRTGGVVSEAMRFNSPIVFAPGDAERKTFASADDANLVLDTIKKAEDSDAVVLRLYECHGARGRARLNIGWPTKRAILCNLLEDEGKTLKVNDGSIEIEYGPYQIVSVKVS
jgi:alpha-mannosidase